MNETAPTPPSEPPSAAKPRSATDWLGDVIPSIGFVFVAGPPVVFLVGVLLVLVLLLIPPAALVFTIALVVVAAAAVIGLAGAVLASPYLVVRHLRARRAEHHASATEAAEHPVPAESAGVAG